MRIGIYGGTFNPIHLGHVRAAQAAAAHLALDRLYLIPAGLPPHKELGSDAAGGEHRLEMTRLAARELGGMAQVLDLEVRREGRSYTVDTLRQLRDMHPEDQLFLLMGTDMFLSFQNWREAGEIAKLCTLCAFSRDSEDTPGLFRDQSRLLAETLGARSVIVPLPYVTEISSTSLREQLSRGLGREYLPGGVYGYILREGLYGVARGLKGLPLEDLRCVALTMLKDSRVPHVLGCEETAARLALRWGEEEEPARRAALLHDCTKKLSWEQQLDLFRQYGVDTSAMDPREEKLVHASTGALVAQYRFGESPAVVSAIRWHTTGRADMTRLEKIIYLADYMEPTRSFCDLTDLRRLAFEDLDQAVLLGLTMAVEALEKSGSVVQIDSVLARDHLKGKLSWAKENM